MDPSKFNLWRACFSFCQVDSELALSEQKWIAGKSEALHFTDEQRAVLLKDLANPPDIDGILPNITKPSDRAFLVDQMRVLAHLDGKVSPEELEKINKVKDEVLSKVNLSDLERKITFEEKGTYFERLHNYKGKE